MMTKWVATTTAADDDGLVQTIHVQGSKADIKDLLLAVPVDWKVEKKAATWECDGRDNCQVDG